ncbi:DUF4232 domain-containing protein [Streptomyces griseoloalbus]|uniref:DUF4232 domain-containing protein n=1 Tax=Streptomyces griseoloalbus TaxID=67303 RepID=A0A7W8BIC3_9ACTN|nr:DUF4232 domain-containing protein [Streptomyces albaduncus]MBB5123892.1 hypothetical protein [Streptomyces albaduncus]GGW77803.1 hypothetical protein GCM10010340_65490 [Streptomyces albaduncus]
MRKSRIRLFAATGVALAALALTACQDGTGTTDEGASESTATATTDTSSGTSSGASKGDATSNEHGQAGGTDAGGGSTDAEKAGNTGSTGKGSDKSAATGTGTGTGTETRVACNGSNTTVTAQPVSRPVNHMLITVKNTGSQPCDLTYYPVLRFDEMQWVPQPVEASQPQSVVGIDPGQSAYAGVLLASADGSGDGGTTGHKLTVGFQGRTPNSDGGPSATPSLPAKGVYYDSTLAVTYWQQSMEDALTY